MLLPAAWTGGQSGLARGLNLVGLVSPDFECLPRGLRCYIQRERSTGFAVGAGDTAAMPPASSDKKKLPIADLAMVHQSSQGRVMVPAPRTSRPRRDPRPFRPGSHCRCSLHHQTPKRLACALRAMVQADPVRPRGIEGRTTGVQIRVQIGKTPRIWPRGPECSIQPRRVLRNLGRQAPEVSRDRPFAISFGLPRQSARAR